MVEVWSSHTNGKLSSSKEISDSLLHSADHKENTEEKAEKKGK